MIWKAAGEFKASQNLKKKQGKKFRKEQPYAILHKHVNDD